MTLTDIVLLVFTAALLLWAIYDRWLLDRLQGETLLAVPLLRGNRIDGAIFVVLVIILLVNNLSSHGALLTSWLLSALALVTIYIFWLRSPEIRFKRKGFFFAGCWVKYERVSAINLSEDGVLVIQLEQRSLLVRVRNIDDLEKIYHFMINNQ